MSPVYICFLLLQNVCFLITIIIGIKFFFYISIIKNLFIKKLVLFLLIVFILTALYVFYKNTIFSIGNCKIELFENFLISCYAIGFFVYSLRLNFDQISTKSHLFWINSGILIYYMPFILIFLFNEYFIKISNILMASLYNTFNNILTLIFITLIIIGFLKSKSQNPNVNLNS